MAQWSAYICQPRQFPYNHSSCSKSHTLTDISPLKRPGFIHQDQFIIQWESLWKWMRIKIHWVLSLPTSHPCSKFRGNPASSNCIILLTNKPKHNLLGRCNEMWSLCSHCQRLWDINLLFQHQLLLITSIHFHESYFISADAHKGQ